MSDRITELFNKYMQGKCSSLEQEELMNLALENRYQPLFKALIDKVPFEETTHSLPEENAHKLWQNIFSNIKADSRKPSKLASLRYWWAAACVAVLVSLGILFWPTGYQQKELVWVVNDDIMAPDNNRAQIQLQNGTVLYLDTLQPENTIELNGMTITKTASGEIVYNSTTATEEIVWNTVSNPKGSKVITLALDDGTKVWLNAATQLTYPVKFSFAEREVSIEGEAFFEVAPSAEKPFFVNVNGGRVKVLGTHFNVKNYSDEPGVYTTLIEGSVAMESSTKQEMRIKPGQQAKMRESGELVLIPQVDVEMITAWIRGELSFKNLDLKSLLLQAARWYDVEVIYKTTVPTDLTFSGTGIPNTVTLSDFLRVLENNKVVFEVDGQERKVMVKKKSGSN